MLYLTHVDLPFFLPSNCSVFQFSLFFLEYICLQPAFMSLNTFVCYSVCSNSSRHEDIGYNNHLFLVCYGTVIFPLHTVAFLWYCDKLLRSNLHKTYQIGFLQNFYPIELFKVTPSIGMQAFPVWISILQIWTLDNIYRFNLSNKFKT